MKRKFFSWLAVRLGIIIFFLSLGSAVDGGGYDGDEENDKTPPSSSIDFEFNNGELADDELSMEELGFYIIKVPPVIFLDEPKKMWEKGNIKFKLIVNDSFYCFDEYGRDIKLETLLVENNKKPDFLGILKCTINNKSLKVANFNKNIWFKKNSSTTLDIIYEYKKTQKQGKLIVASRRTME